MSEPQIPEHILNYVRLCKEAGMPADQVRNFSAAGIVLQPKQILASAAARACDAPDGPTEVGFGGARGGGKSTPLSTYVLSPSGWIANGNLKIGDTVCTPDGGTATVLAVHDRGPLGMVRVRFHDGSSAICSLDHLWTVDWPFLPDGSGTRPTWYLQRWLGSLSADRRPSIPAAHCVSALGTTRIGPRRIEAIEPCGRDEARCITISNPNGLYIIDDFVVTHNSHWMISQMAADDCQRASGLKCLVLRSVGKAVRESFEDLRVRALMQLPHTYKRQEGVLIFPNGSRMILGHFKNERDIDNYLGLEYDLIGIEEATTLSPRKYRDISSCNRTSKMNWRPRIYSTTNPGGISHSNYRDRFIKPFREGKETNTRFIPALHSDNKFLNQDYIKILNTFTGWQLRAWRDGDWDIAAGQYFTTFRRDVHVIRPIEVKEHWTVWGALDYGFNHYTVFYLFTKDDDGNYFVVDEHAKRGWLPPRHTDAIKQMLARHNVRIERLNLIAAGLDVFSRESSGKTIAQQYSENGVRLTPANSDRVNGAARILELLGDVDANIKPKLFITELCPRLADCLPELQHDPNRPEDVLKWDTDSDGVGGDDAYDCCAKFDTKILTQRGSVQIAYVNTSDNVMTRKGWRRCLWSGMTKASAFVYEVSISSGESLTLTGSHPVFVIGRGFVPVTQLKIGDQLWHYQKPSCLTESSSGVTQTQNATTSETTTTQVGITSKKELGHCTLRFGSLTTGMFRRGLKFITRTRILLTTQSRTLSVLPGKSTNPNTQLQSEEQNYNRIGLNLLQPPSTGTEAKRGESGIKSMEHEYLQQDHLEQGRVNNAAGTTRQRTTVTVDSVPTTVAQRFEGNQAWTTSVKRVPCAKKNSPSTDTQSPKLVPVVVVSVSAKTEKIPVYNLSVEDCEEYFANGVLVHNCRYGLASRTVTVVQSKLVGF